jgi:hypothetical protein
MSEAKSIQEILAEWQDAKVRVEVTANSVRESERELCALRNKAADARSAEDALWKKLIEMREARR